MGRPLVRMAPRAVAWLEAEIAWLAERNPAAARAVLKRFRDAQRRLAEWPGMARPGILPGTRRLVVDSYVLTIQRRDGVIEIVAIRHGRQMDSDTPPEACEAEATELISDGDE